MNVKEILKSMKIIFLIVIFLLSNIFVFARTELREPDYMVFCDIKPVNISHVEIIRCAGYQHYPQISCDSLSYLDDILHPKDIVQSINRVEIYKNTRIMAGVYISSRSKPTIYFLEYITDQRNLLEISNEKCSSEQLKIQQEIKSSREKISIINVIGSFLSIFLPIVLILFILIKLPNGKFKFFSLDKKRLIITVLLTIMFWGFSNYAYFLSIPSVIQSIIFFPILLLFYLLRIPLESVSMAILITLSLIYSYILSGLFIYIVHKINARHKSKK